MVGHLKLKDRSQVTTIAEELTHASIMGYTITIMGIHNSKSLLINHYSNGEIVRQSTVGPRGGVKVKE